MHEDYAWDRSGPADAFIVEMEDLLGDFDTPVLAADGERLATLHREPVRRRTDRKVFWVSVAAAAALVLIGLGLWRGTQTNPPEATVTPAVSAPPNLVLPPPSVVPDSPAPAALDEDKGFDGDTLLIIEEVTAAKSPTGITRTKTPSQTPADPVAAAGPSEIGAALTRQQPQLAACANAEPLDHETLTKSLQLRFTVSVLGKVESARVKNAHVAPKVSRCVVETVSGWTFPAHDVPGGQPMVLWLELDQLAKPAQ